MEELHRRNRKYVEFQVSDAQKACFLLEEKYKTMDFSVREDETIRLYNHFEQRGQINASFSEHGIEVTGLHLNEEKLEDYFSSLIGGGSIG